MAGKDGGTQIYCPQCKRERICKAVSPTKLGKESGRRWYFTEHPEIQWFRRGRQCLSCGHKFITSEVSEQFLDELVELRQELSEIKSVAEEVEKTSKAARTRLRTLIAKLQTLKALDE